MKKKHTTRLQKKLDRAISFYKHILSKQATPEYLREHLAAQGILNRQEYEMAQKLRKAYALLDPAGGLGTPEEAYAAMAQEALKVQRDDA